MGKQRFFRSLLCFVFVLTVASVNARLRIDDGFIQCVHERNTNVSIVSYVDSMELHFLIMLLTLHHTLKLVYGVQQDSSGSRRKRETTSQFQPFRIHVHYDSTVDTE